MSVVTQLSEPSSATAAPSTITLQNGMTYVSRSNVSKEPEQVPIINVAGIYSSKLEDRQAVADQIREAATKIGFFYAINHVSFMENPVLDWTTKVLTATAESGHLVLRKMH
jgi:hypothetical protein